MTQARFAIAAGVDVLQVRERDLEARELVELCREIVVAARGSQCRVVVNDRLDIALACGADGVHLRGDSMPSALVREMAPRGFLVGRSVHSVEQAAAAGDVDYLIAGTVWATDSKPDLSDEALLGPRRLAEIVERVSVPVLAIGGVSLARLAAVSASGAAGVAAIGLFMGEAEASRLCRAVPLAETVQIARRRFDTPDGAS
jgi:thiamine-phosphate pyrophosphorylase